MSSEPIALDFRTIEGIKVPSPGEKDLSQRYRYLSEWVYAYLRPGFGGMSLSNVYGTANDEESKEVLRHAIKIGAVRHSFASSPRTSAVTIIATQVIITNGPVRPSGIQQTSTVMDTSEDECIIFAGLS